MPTSATKRQTELIFWRKIQLDHPVVVPRDIEEPLLAGRVPDLQLDPLPSAQLDSLDPEVDPDGRDVVEAEARFN